MYSLLLTVLFFQVEFEKQNPIVLEHEAFQFAAVTVLADDLLICNSKDLVICRFGKDGTLKNKIGGDGQGDGFQLPHEISWFEDQKRLYVYDGARLDFSIWELGGKYQKTIKTDFDIFFKVGPLLSVDQHFVAPVSLVQEEFLVGKFDQEFKPVKYGYEIANYNLVDVSPVLQQCFVSQAIVDGSPRILAIQSLASNVDVMDFDLNLVRSFILGPVGWKPADHQILQRVSKNPRELEKYQEQYSEAVCLVALEDNLFLVGFRNLLSPRAFTYQVYDGNTGSSIGNSLDLSFTLVGHYKDTLYFLDPNTQDNMTLTVYGVKH